MTQDEVIAYVAGLAGVVQTAVSGDGSPEIAWGDSFYPPCMTGPYSGTMKECHPSFAAAVVVHRGVLSRRTALGMSGRAAIALTV
jgi:hypothetical protein